MALILTEAEKAIIDALEPDLEEAFMNGVQNPDTSEAIEPMSGYASAAAVKVHEDDTPVDYRPEVKGPFKALIAAFLRNLTPENETVFTTGDLDNGWTTATGVCFYRDALGRVFVRGAIADGSAPTGVCTLPEGYRPGSERVFPVYTSVTGYGSVAIAEDGTVAALTGDGVFYLDGISFRAA